jgi:esterase/lipase
MQTTLACLSGLGLLFAGINSAKSTLQTTLYECPRQKQSKLIVDNLYYWFIQKSTPLILIYYHGKGCTVTDIIPFLEFLADLVNISIVAPEYPLYAAHDTRYEKCNQESIEKDADCLIQKLNEWGYLPNNIYVHGYSLGCNPAIYIASKYKQIGGLFLEAPMESVAALINQYIQHKSNITTPDVLKHLLSFVFPEWKSNLERIKQVTTRVWFLHGQRDSIIPIQQAKNLFTNCSSKQKHLRIHMGQHQSEVEHCVDILRHLIYK